MRLIAKLSEAKIADGDVVRGGESAQHGVAACTAVSRKDRCENVIYSGDNGMSGTSQDAARTSQDGGGRAPVLYPIQQRAWRTTGRSPAGDIERIVLHAFAEDAPHSPALQVDQTAPWRKYSLTVRLRQ